MLFGFVCIACAFEKRELAETPILKTVFLHFIPSFRFVCGWLDFSLFGWTEKNCEMKIINNGIGN